MCSTSRSSIAFYFFIRVERMGFSLWLANETAGSPVCPLWFTRLMSMPASYNVPRLQSEFVEWISQWPWSRFITLASNDPMLRTRGACSLLRKWDGHINRQLLGPRWQKRSESALFAFYFLEKADRNAHWHALVYPKASCESLRNAQLAKLDAKAAHIWTKLCPSGSVETLAIYEKKNVASYVAKSFGDAISYEEFVVPGQFIVGS